MEEPTSCEFISQTIYKRKVWKLKGFDGRKNVKEVGCDDGVNNLGCLSHGGSSCGMQQLYDPNVPLWSSFLPYPVRGS